MNTDYFDIENSLATIRKSTHMLLWSHDYNDLRESVHQLHEIFGGITAIKAAGIDDEDIYLAQGKAISPVKAAYCLLEFERTRRFLRGIYKAIKQQIAINPGHKIQILYAGCGPYATLLTPLTSVFTSEEVGFTLLDINSHSLEAAMQLYNVLDLMAYINDFVQADATAYQTNPDTDIIISETMLNGLIKEPQVAIMNNLIPQLSPTGIFIPEAITINAALLNATEEQNSFFHAGLKPQRINVGHVYNATKPFQLPKAITLPLVPSATHRSLNLLTEITVFGDEKLHDYSCSLTLPLKLLHLPANETPKQITFNYQMGAKPGFSFLIS